MKVKRRTIEVPVLWREATLDVRAIDKEKRTVPVIFSTENPVGRWFGEEILDHAKSAVDLKVLRDVGSVLVNHDPSKAVGKPVNVRIEDRQGKADVQFGTKPFAEETFLDIQEEVIRGVSVGYVVQQMKLVETSEGGRDVYRITRWQPREFSFTPIPADAGSKVGRAQDETDFRELLEEARREGRPVFECEVLEEEEDLKKCKHCGREHEGELCGCDRSRGIVPAVAVLDADPVAEERARVKAIRELGEKYEQAELARQFIDNGQSASAMRDVILERLGARMVTLAEVRDVAKTKQADPVGMSAAEVKRFSFFRLIRALGAEKGDAQKARADAAFELEVCAEQAKRVGKDPEGVYLPNEVIFGSRMYEEQREITKTTEGADIVGSVVDGAQLIDVLRNKSKALELGTALPGLKSDLIIPRMSAGASGAFVAEGGSNSQTATFDSITLAARTVTAYTDITRKLLIQTSPQVEALIRSDLALAIGLAIDSAAIQGDGSPEPVGILNTAGIGAVVSGGTPSWSEVVELWSDVSGANADVGSLAFLTSPKIAGVLLTTVRAGTFPVFLLQDDFTMLGYGLHTSNQVPQGTPAASALIFGNWSDLLIGFWDALDLVVDPYTLAHLGKIRLRVIHEADVGVRHPGSFSAMEDLN